jgi:hypothetical protein
MEIRDVNNSTSSLSAEKVNADALGIRKLDDNSSTSQNSSDSAKIKISYQEQNNPSPFTNLSTSQALMYNASQILRGISGVIGLAEKSENISRRDALNREAKQLVSAYNELASQLRRGIPPTVFQPSIREELEAEVGKALDLILKEPPNDIKLTGVEPHTTRDVILDTRAVVEKSRQEIEKMITQLEEFKKELQLKKDSDEIPRDHESAKKLVQATVSTITEKIEEAVLSVQKLR